MIPFVPIAITMVSSAVAAFCLCGTWRKRIGVWCLMMSGLFFIIMVMAS